jgi:hypothetical protein
MLLSAVLALEALHPASGIDQPLRTGIEGMAIRADLDLDIGQRRMRFEGVAASASHHAAAVLWMDSSFHLTLCLFVLHVKDIIANPLAQFTPPVGNASPLAPARRLQHRRDIRNHLEYPGGLI